MLHTRTSRAIAGAACIGIVLAAVALTGRWDGGVVRPVSVIAGSVGDALHGELLVGDAAAPTSTSNPAPSSGQTGSEQNRALAILDELPATAAKRIPEYRRIAFGPTWQDVDGNGCSTRNDILARDLTDVQRAPDGCTVLSGVLNDPYTGKRIDFRRGVDTSAAVQIDHRVPLALAWRSGAWAWTDRQRAAFANDPANLVAVDGPTNTAKSDSGPGEWTPPNAAYRCAYDRAYINLLKRYRLTVSADDRAALRRGLEGCR
ncbi:HNH endonuclease family protein [Curtobacterium sp. 20TX0008]|uniref:HNH endonuclease family protein n=1 Tax=Curtobacterium sp. 20TX0008 TaxID=3022018 RepID=UPI00232FC26D|nr:HNH endonuclease family protein [Curtobacterium sp. 20TX0008]MDB6425929.1 HNH endonuclease family protein [Curtobacterium sp. 20TX0008]